MDHVAKFVECLLCTHSRCRIRTGQITDHGINLHNGGLYRSWSEAVQSTTVNRHTLKFVKVLPNCHTSSLNGQYKSFELDISGGSGREYISGSGKEPPRGYPVDTRSTGGHSGGNSTATSKSMRYTRGREAGIDMVRMDSGCHWTRKLS